MTACQNYFWKNESQDFEAPVPPASMSKLECQLQVSRQSKPSLIWCRDGVRKRRQILTVSNVMWAGNYLGTDFKRKRPGPSGLRRGEGREKQPWARKPSRGETSVQRAFAGVVFWRLQLTAYVFALHPRWMQFCPEADGVSLHPGACQHDCSLPSQRPSLLLKPGMRGQL